MKKTVFTFAVIAVLAVFLSSCAGQRARRSTMKPMNDMTGISIRTDAIDTVKLMFAEEGSGETIMLKSDYAGFAGFLSTAVYDTAWNDSGIMVKMVTPDYTAIISYKGRNADENDWLMIWKENGRAKFRDKWFFIAENQREGLYALLEKYWSADSGVGMSVWPGRNGGAPQTLQLTVRNNTDEAIQFGADYSIERLADDKWVEVDLGNFAVIDILYIVQPGDSGQYTISLFTERVTYPEGDYRVVKQINVGENNSRPYYANFRIIEPR